MNRMETAQAITEEVPPPPTFRQVHDEGWAHVWRTLRRCGVEERDCDDVTQEVFVVVHRRLPDYDPGRRLLPWLSGIARLKALEYRRKHRRLLPVPPEVELENLLCRGPFDVDHARRELVLYLLESVKPDRDMLLMHHVDEMPTAEIAGIFGITEKAVEGRLVKAREQFTAAWQRYQIRARRETRGAVVLPLFGALAMLDALRDLPIPAGTGERIRAGLQHFEHDSGGRGWGPVAPPRILTARAVALPIAGALAFTLELGILIGLRLAGPAPVEVTPERITAAATLSAAPSAAPLPAASASPSVTAAPSAPPGGTSEDAFLKDAEHALAEGRTGAALAALDAHARYCRRGGCRLLYKAETLQIHALLRAGQRAEAQAQIERFAAAHPNDARAADLRAQLQR
jgi:RNA polymerase sigma factor (sigma-70 family)